MKVLHMVNDAETGGAQTLIESLATCRDGETHILVLLGPGALSPRLEAAATSVHYARLGRRSFNILRPIRLARTLVKRYDIDILHSHLMQSDLVSILCGLEVAKVSTVHTSGSHESNLMARIVSRMVAAASRRLDAIVACSPSALAYVRGARYAYRGIVPIVMNGSHVEPSPPERHVRTDNALSLARWHPMKDHETLFRAIAKVRNTASPVRLTCAGHLMDGRNAELASAVAKQQLGDSVHLIGTVSDVPLLMVENDFLIISSAYGEALPMAGIEALARGLPVVTTDVGDCAQLAIAPELLVRPRDPQGLAEAMLFLQGLSDDEYEALRYRAWDRARQLFDARHAAHAYERLYEQHAAHSARARVGAAK